MWTHLVRQALALTRNAFRSSRKDLPTAPQAFPITFLDHDSILSPSLRRKLSTLAPDGYPGGGADLSEILAEFGANDPSAIARVGAEASSVLQETYAMAGGSAERSVRLSRAQSLLATDERYAWILLFDPCGHVRQVALERIRSPPTTAFFYMALAWRLNDWAKEVGEAAR
jgi:hypothetical protein